MADIESKKVIDRRVENVKSMMVLQGDDNCRGVQRASAVVPLARVMFELLYSLVISQKIRSGVT